MVRTSFENAAVPWVDGTYIFGKHAKAKDGWHLQNHPNIRLSLGYAFCCLLNAQDFMSAARIISRFLGVTPSTSQDPGPGMNWGSDPGQGSSSSSSGQAQYSSATSSTSSNLPQQNPWSTPAAGANPWATPSGGNPWPNAATDKIWEELRKQQEETQRRISEANAAIEESLRQLQALEKEKLEKLEKLRVERANAAANAHPTRWEGPPSGVSVFQRTKLVFLARISLPRSHGGP